jgi:hypothetical protein
LNGIEPAAWLKDTMEKLPVWPNSRIDELLPLRPNFDRKIGVSLFPTKTWVVFSAENVPMYVKDISIALT